MYDDLNNKPGEKGLSGKFDVSAKPTMTVDVERYQAYLDGSNMSNAEKEEFLQALWQVIFCFVELGFGAHPLQGVCGKDVGTAFGGAKAAIDEVCSTKPENEENPNGPNI